MAKKEVECGKKRAELGWCDNSSYFVFDSEFQILSSIICAENFPFIQVKTDFFLEIEIIACR